MVAAEVAAVDQGGDLLGARGFPRFERNNRKLYLVMLTLVTSRPDDHVVLSVDTPEIR